jgi:hypothetical protein
MANKKFLNPINLVNLASDPLSGTEGDIYYNNISDGIRLYKNGAWTDLSSTGALPSGGATGQILAKSSNTDYAVEWIENYADYTETVKLKVKNDGTRALYKGEPVYVTGSDGTNVLIGRSSNATEGSSSKTIGLLAQNLATNGQGFVIKEGKLGTLDTSTAGAVGDPVWLGVDGALIYGLANKPYGPAHLVYLGVVTKKNGSTGEIFVQVQNGFELQELHNVGIGYGNSIADNEVLAYDITSGTWINQTPAEAGLATTTDLYDYLTESDAILLYQPVSVRLYNLTALENVEGFLRTDGGLGWSVDTATYLTTGNASTTYLSQENAASTYLTQTSAASTYLTPTSAGALYQPLDADLTAIAGLSGTSGILKKTLTNTWTLDTNTYLTTTDAQSLYQPTGSYATLTGIETLTNKTISSAVVNDILTFDDGGDSSTIDVSGNNLTINASTDLYLTTTTGSIILNPDHFVKIGTEYVATQEWVDEFYQPVGSYLTTETDPVFTAHASYGITSTKISNWDSAYGWGDHASAGYSPSSHNHALDSLSNVVITGTPTDGQAIVWDTTTSKWINETVTGGSGSTVTVSATAPTSPVIGDGWYDNTDGTYHVYDGTYWVEITSVVTMSQEQAQDLVAPLLDHASHSGLTASYDDANNKLVLTVNETDPVFLASESYNITSTDTTNWDSAYGWGNHSVAGYLTSESDTLSSVTGRGATTSDSITISNTTQSTTPTSGALIISGGVGISKDVWIDGNLYVNGTTITENTQTVATHDNLIYLNAAQDSTITNAVGDGTYVTYTAENKYTVGMDIRVTGMNPSGYNISSGDGLTVYSATSTQFVVAKTTTGTFVSGGTAHAKEEANPDLGFAGGYYNAGYAHAGLFRDASDGIFKIFDGYTPEPDEAVNIDTTHASFSFAPIKVESLDVVDASTTRTNLGLAIGTNVQAYNSTLAAVAGGTYTGDDSITTLGTIATGTWNGTEIGTSKGGTGLTTIGTAGQVLKVNAGATALEWGTIDALPSQSGNNGKYLTTNGSTASWGTLDLSLYLTISSASTSYQPLDSELTALAGLTSAADLLPYFTGSGTASTTTLTTFGRSLIDDADASTARTTLGLAIGTNVQAYSATLAGINTLGSGTGFLKNTAGTWSYDNSNYLTTSSASTTYATIVSPNLTTPNIGAATGTSLTTTGNVISHIDILTPTFVTNSYTLTIGDDGDLLMLNNSATAGNLLIPTDASVNFPIGTQINIVQQGTGLITVAAVTPGTTTLNATPGAKLRAQWSSATLIKRAANTWLLIGDLTV